ncbi:MAG: hypothetical protein IJV81_01255 [Paludibacteraceae bacterium]|nr:hypothetical protein [Paludibacteraceae bacterium]
MDPKYLENLNDTELADLFTLMCEAHQIMKDVVARTGKTVSVTRCMYQR